MAEDRISDDLLSKLAGKTSDITISSLKDKRPSLIQGADKVERRGKDLSISQLASIVKEKFDEGALQVERGENNMTRGEDKQAIAEKEEEREDK